jgi:tetratricopeptide (TPR) repeat protein
MPMPFRITRRGGGQSGARERNQKPRPRDQHSVAVPNHAISLSATKKKEGTVAAAADISGITFSFESSQDELGGLVPPPTIDNIARLRVEGKRENKPHQQILQDLLKPLKQEDAPLSMSKKSGTPPGKQHGEKKVQENQGRTLSSPASSKSWGSNSNSNSNSKSSKKQNGKGKFMFASSASRDVNKKKEASPLNKLKPANKKNSTCTGETHNEDNECEWRVFDSHEIATKASESFISLVRVPPPLSRPLAGAAVGLSLLAPAELEEQWNDPPAKMVRESIYRHVQISMNASSEPGKKKCCAEPAKADEVDVTATRGSLPVDVDDRCFLETVTEENVDAMALRYIAGGNPHGALAVLSVLLQDQRQERINNTESSFEATALEEQIATTKSKLALVSLLAMNPRDAWQYSISALQTHKKAGRPVQSAFATMELGLVYMGTDKLSEALKAWREALQLACMTLGYDHGQVAVLLSNLGCLHYYLGNFPACLRALEESLGLQRQLLRSISPEDSVDIPLFQMALTMGNLALVTGKCNNYDAAISLLEEALAIEESILATTEQVKTITLGWIERFTLLRKDAEIKDAGNRASLNSTIQTNAGCFSLLEPFRIEKTHYPAVSAFGDCDGIPRRHEGGNHYDSSSHGTGQMFRDDDNTFDCMELGSMVNPSTTRERVHATVLRSLGLTRDKSQHDVESSMFSSTAAVSRKKQSIPVDLDADTVLDAELHLHEIQMQALDHLAVCSRTCTRSSEIACIFQRTNRFSPRLLRSVTNTRTP